MSEPILVLNCGSSSVKFAVFDASVEPLPRKASWCGRCGNSVGRTSISRSTSSLRVAVEPTNEEWMAARQALATLRRAASTIAAPNRAFCRSDERQGYRRHDPER